MGLGISLVGIDTPDTSVPIASYVPLMMFAVLFGLSMDYEVFLVSHIQRTTTRRRAGAAGGRRPASASSARITSAAALIMASVFASFILNGDPMIKQFGVGLATAVLLAGILVVTLAPATIVLFGERRVVAAAAGSTRILPHISVEGETMPAAERAAGGRRRGRPVAGAVSRTGVATRAGRRSVRPAPRPRPTAIATAVATDKLMLDSQQVGSEVAQVALVGPELTHHPADGQEHDDERRDAASQPRTTATRWAESRSSDRARVRSPPRDDDRDGGARGRGPTSRACPSIVGHGRRGRAWYGETDDDP